MQLTFADVPLVCPDEDGVLTDWHDRYLSAEDIELFFPLVDCHVGQRAIQDHALEDTRFPVWPSMPKLKLSSLYIPTGATRWSVGLFYVTYDQLQDIKDALDSDQEAYLKFDLREDYADTPSSEDLLQYKLQLIQTRVLSPDELYLIVLVDPRYNWQYVNTEYLEGDINFAWYELLEALQVRTETNRDSLDPSDISGEWLLPHRMYHLMQMRNVATALDAAAANVGCRNILQPFQEASTRAWEQRCQSVTESKAILADNIARIGNNSETQRPSNLVAGGDNSDVIRVPYSCTVTFPEWLLGIEPYSGNKTVVTKTASDYDAGSDSDHIMPDNTDVVFDSTVAAILDGSDYKNQSEMDSYASRVAGAFYGWMEKSYDYTFSYIPYWKLSGYDDYMMIHCGYQDPKKGDAPLITTRIKSMPVNEQPFFLWAQTHTYTLTKAYDRTPYDGTAWFKATEDWEDNPSSYTPHFGRYYVTAKPCTKVGGEYTPTDLDPVFVYLPRVPTDLISIWGGSTYYNHPEVYMNQVFMATRVNDEWVLQEHWSSMLGDIRFFVNAPHIPTGWRLCDGDELPDDKKVSDTHAPDMEDRFPLVSTSSGSTGGYASHGQYGINNHLDHTTGTAAAGTDITVVTNGTHSGGPFYSGGFLNTDNRPPYFGVGAIFRYK